MVHVAALALALQQAVGGWSVDEGPGGTSYRKGDASVLVIPHEGTRREGEAILRGYARRTAACERAARTPVKTGQGGVWAAMAESRGGTLCGLMGADLGDGRSQLAILVAPGAAEDGGEAFREAGALFGRLADRSRARAAGGAAVASKPAARAPATSAEAEALLAKAAAAVPDANKPVHVVTYGRGANVGWPPAYVYYVDPVYLFEGGRGHDCEGADPAALDWTALAAADDCSVWTWRPQGTGVAYRKVGDTAWQTQEPNAEDHYAPGERIDVQLLNRSGIGVDLGAGSIPVSTLQGRNLLLTPEGRIVMTGYSTTLALGQGVAAYSAGETPPIEGTYRLDGHVITILPDGADRPIQAYVLGQRRDGHVGHVFLGGTHYWDPDD